MEHIPHARPRNCMLVESCLYFLYVCYLYIYMHRGYTIISILQEEKESCWLCCCSDFAAIVCTLFHCLFMMLD